MNHQSKPIKTKEMYQRDLTTSRMNLLLSVIFTVMNLGMIFLSLDTSFLFSAAIPHSLSLFFAISCGMFDASYYKSVLEAEFPNGWEAEFPNGWESAFQFADPSLFRIVFAFSIVIVVGLFLLWFFSKKYKVCSMITLCYYIVDSLFLLAFSFYIGAGGIDLIFQILFHAWIVYYAVLSVRAWKGMATAPTMAEVAAKAGYGYASHSASPYGNTYSGYHYDDEDEEEATAATESAEESEEDDTSEEEKSE